jgi:hypothetical protein
VGVLATRLAGRVGWYYHDPLEHGAVASWGWGAAALLMDARARGRQDETMARWDDRQITVRPTGDGVELGPDAWAVVAALAGTIPTSELRVRLGWDVDRLTGALEELDRSGALPLPGARPVHQDLSATVRAAEEVLAAVDADRGPVAVDLTRATASHQGPLSPPPVLAVAGGDARGALRRLRSGRR